MLRSFVRAERQPSPARSASITASTLHQIFVALFLLSSSRALADSTNLAPIADTTLSENYANHNFGAMPFVNSGTTQNITKNRALFKFDIRSAVPVGSKIISAYLVLSVMKVPADDPNVFSNFHLHRLLKDWGEGDKVTAPGAPGPGSGAVATTNEATWQYRFGFTTNTWTSPGGAATNDYISAISSSQTVYGTIDSPYAFGSTPLTVADVQLWLDNPQTNFGWILMTAVESAGFTARRFASREDTNNWPQLYLDYDPPPPLIDQVQVSGKQINLFFTAASNQTYIVEFRSDLVSGNWQTLANVGPFPDTTRVLVVDPISQPRRFYRARPN